MSSVQADSVRACLRRGPGPICAKGEKSGLQGLTAALAQDSLPQGPAARSRDMTVSPPTTLQRPRAGPAALRASAAYAEGELILGYLRQALHGRRCLFLPLNRKSPHFRPSLKSRRSLPLDVHKRPTEQRRACSRAQAAEAHWTPRPPGAFSTQRSKPPPTAVPPEAEVEHFRDGSSPQLRLRVLRFLAQRKEPASCRILSGAQKS